MNLNLGEAMILTEKNQRLNLIRQFFPKAAFHKFGTGFGLFADGFHNQQASRVLGCGASEAEATLDAFRAIADDRPPFLPDDMVILGGVEYIVHSNHGKFGVLYSPTLYQGSMIGPVYWSSGIGTVQLYQLAQQYIQV